MPATTQKTPTDQPPVYNPPASITSATLAPSTAPAFQPPAATPIAPASSIAITPPATLTPEEQQAQSATTQLQDLNNQLTGQSDYRASQEQAQGLDALNKTYADLSGRLKTLQADALNIPNQTQLDAEGRGITAAGLAPITTSQLRRNSIEANSVGALLAASQGQITHAQSLVDKAVSQKFDPIQEQITAATNNLNLILNSPEYTLEQKNRAQQQLDIQNQRAADLAKQKEDASTIYGLALTAAKNGADALTAQRIQNASSPQEALNILSASGFALDALQKAQIADIPLDRQLKQAQLANTYSQIAERNNPAAKPATQAQQTIANYASRLVQSNDIINTLTPTISKSGVFSYGVEGMLPSAVQSSTRQQYEQAKKNFVNAVLRQESGAAISDGEFKSAESQYFPQPGDSAETIANKAANRDLVVRNFKTASGNAYEAPPAAGPQTYTANGKTYVQAADGLYYPQ